VAKMDFQAIEAALEKSLIWPPFDGDPALLEDAPDGYWRVMPGYHDGLSMLKVYGGFVAVPPAEADDSDIVIGLQGIYDFHLEACCAQDPRCPGIPPFPVAIGKKTGGKWVSKAEYTATPCPHFEE